ncbi:MAG: ATP-binding protein, partial [Desulfovibrionaceae bacterium]|nr:ATP-binding protein [Desulfovibrionaceae bacterium]
QSPDSSPKHILLYGAPGTGKTTFARSLMSALKVKAWSVPCKEGDSTHDRRAALTACVLMAKQHQGDFVLVDEAEYLLDTDLHQSNIASPKAWLNYFLEQPHLRIIWITNFVEHLEPAVRRRFTYSINFPEAGRKERTNLWRDLAQRLNLPCVLSEEQIEMLAERYSVQVAVMESSMRQSMLISDHKDFLPHLEQLLSAQMTLQNNGFKFQVKPENQERLELAASCTEQPVQTLISKFKRIDAYLRQKNPLKPGMCNILFYGPPGTGKSALARHLAQEIERPCLERRASDILDCFVGVTEKNLAQAFARALEDEAVLIIDEVDSFLQAREGARHNWEVTQVNEFLTQLENFKGICICTTNHRISLDSAAMRRFSFKVPFTYAKPPQLKALYLKLLAPLAKGATPPQILEQLYHQPNLTPGDFAAVQRQFWMEDPEKVTHEELLRNLLREQNLKLEDSLKKVGF